MSNIKEITKGVANLSTLAAALEKTGLANDLGGSTEVTLFAPTDAAFSALPHPYRNASDINGITDQGKIDTLRSILLYHMLVGELKEANFTNGVLETKRPSGDGYNKFFLSKNPTGSFINGTTRILPEIDATNGVVHSISQVLMPPTHNILDFIFDNPNFTTLLKALEKTNLKDTLANSASNLTLFAPTNTAFRILPSRFQSADSIDAITDQGQLDYLRNLLLYHSVGSRLFSPDFVTNDVVTTSASSPNNTVRVTAGTPTTVLPIADTLAANVTGTDRMGINGVIHVIDRVLRPN